MATWIVRETTNAAQRIATAAELETVTSDQTATASGTVIPVRQALLVVVAAGLRYGFDSYSVNIFAVVQRCVI